LDIGLRKDGTVVLYAPDANANADGIFGDGTTTAEAGVIASVPGITTAKALAVHGDDWSPSPAHACVILGPSGAVSSCRNNERGAGGNGRTGDRVTSPSPVAIPGNDAVVAIAAGAYFSCAAGATGKVYCWGDNSLGQLGISGVPSYPLPVAVAGVSGAAGVTA